MSIIYIYISTDFFILCIIVKCAVILSYVLKLCCFLHKSGLVEERCRGDMVMGNCIMVLHEPAVGKIVVNDEVISLKFIKLNECQCSTNHDIVGLDMYC